MTAGPGERQPGESGRAYGAFLMYRDMGPSRTLARVVDLVGAKPATVDRWADQHGWFIRAAQCDVETDREERLADAEQAKSYRKQSVRIANLMQAKALARLVNLDPEKMTVTEVRQYIETSQAILERVHVGSEPMPAFTDLSQEDTTRRLRAISQELVRRLDEV